jgi:serine/threonine protein kinase
MVLASEAPHEGTGLRPGSRLGKYQIIHRLALGGMAELYLARYLGGTGFEKVVAIKRVHAHLAEDEDFVRMFLNEARLAAGLDHQNIVHVIDFGTVGGDHFMAMEYVHGRGVHEILRAAKSAIPIECALTIVQGVASALHYTHERAGNDGRPMGLVHRDVSPSNILISHEGEVKLADFGIAKATAITRATRTGTIKGKLAYMAPEQVRGEDLDRRADLFSLGAVLYELTTGRRCFYAPGEFALINRVAEGRFTKPTSAVPGFPAALESIILGALQVNREERYASARALQQDIEDYATDERIQLSPIALSEFMRELFGEEVYPKTDVIPLPAAGTVPTQSKPLATAVFTKTLRARARQPVTWIVVAGVVGLTIGLGSQAFMGHASKASAEHDAHVGATDEEPQADPVVPADPAENGPDVVIIEPESIESPDAETVDPPPVRRKRPRASRKTRSSRNSNAESQPPVQEYLPPSRRQ